MLTEDSEKDDGGQEKPKKLKFKTLSLDLPEKVEN